MGCRGMSVARPRALRPSSDAVVRLSLRFFALCSSLEWCVRACVCVCVPIRSFALRIAVQGTKCQHLASRVAVLCCAFGHDPPVTPSLTLQPYIYHNAQQELHGEGRDTAAATREHANLSKASAQKRHVIIVSKATTKGSSMEREQGTRGPGRLWEGMKTGGGMHNNNHQQQQNSTRHFRGRGGGAGAAPRPN